MPELDEIEIVPTDEWGALLEAQIPRLRAYARMLCSDPVLADDLVQDCMVRALKARCRFRAGSNLSAWLTVIMRNHYITLVRKKRELPDPDGAHTESLVALPDQDDRMELQDLGAALKRLPHEQREALLLVAVQGFSYQEVADLTEVALGTVKSRVSRAKTSLECVLESGDAPLEGRKRRNKYPPPSNGSHTSLAGL